VLKTFTQLARIGTLITFVVVVAGAWVRLTDAGLGCPDWPGCYGRLIVAESLISEERAEAFGRALDTGAAWREMIHRYLASGLGLLVIALCAIALRNRRDPAQPVAAPFALLALVIFQGLLGMWTVTLLLKPIIVVAHLFGGFATLSLLFWLSDWRAPAVPVAPRVRTLALAATALLIAQIGLGGWTSANYAALVCPDFPTCQTQWWPEIADFGEGFVLWRGLGVDYEFGVLDHPARVAIHFAHRLGALVATAALIALALALMRVAALRPNGIAIFAVLGAQLVLGVSIILFGVPLAVAVAHNGVAALLLLTVLNAHQRIWQS
jgi:heme a synthase